MHQIPRDIKLLVKDDQIFKTDKEHIEMLLKDIKTGWILPTDLLKYKEIFRRYCDFKYLNLKLLQRSAYFMRLEPVTGFNIINNVLKIIRVQIPLDLPIFSFIAKQFIVRELNMYFSRLRKEDEYLNFEMLNNMKETDLDKLCFVRGIDINQNIKEKLGDLKLWLSISNQRNVPHSLLLFIRIHEFNKDQFEISDDEDEQDVLRRVSFWNNGLISFVCSHHRTLTTWRRCESSKRPSAWTTCLPRLIRCTPNSG